MYKKFTRFFCTPEGYIHKFILAMKLIPVFIILFLLQVNAKTVAQKITYANKHASLEQIFKQIRKQTGYNVLVSSDKLAGAQQQDVDFNNTPLKSVLELALKGMPLTYQIENKTILIKEKEASFIDQLIAAITAIPVHGRVVDEKGEPMPGVTILIKGKSAVLTNIQGEFDVSAVEEKVDVSISFIGYKTQVLKAAKDMGTIRMQIVVSELDQVQVIGYGTTSKRFNTGSITTVKAADIQNQPLTNPMQTLQGMVPGLYIQQASGLPGAKTKVLLRGNNSLTSGSNPLYIIDGVPFNGNSVDKQLGGGTTLGNLTNGGTDPLNSINPSDIESFDVLKDADATSIYGSRAANGVIIITTKHASGGKVKVSANVYKGVSKVGKLLPTLSTAEYLAIRRKAFANDGITPTTVNAPDLLLWSQSDNTDYEKMLTGNTAHTTDATASVMGGNAQNGFLLSGSFHDETTVMLGDYGYKRGSIHGKSNFTSADGKFKADFSTIYSVDFNKLTGGDYTTRSTTYPGNYPLYNANGSLYFGGNLTNPIAQFSKYYKTQTTNLIINSALTYSVSPDLQFKINLGNNNISFDQKQLTPLIALNPALSTSSSGGYYTNNFTSNYIFEPQADYNTTIAKGKLGLTIGGAYQYTSFQQPYYVDASGFLSDALLENFSAASSINIVKSYDALYKYLSGFARLNYNWDSKYIFNATIRRDGSSRFSPAKQYGNFGSVGAAWLFTEQGFMKKQTWLSYGKLRGSYGTVGNDQISNYGYMDTYGASFGSYGPTAGLVPSRIANPDYSWETTRKLEAAVELGFFNNNILFNATWFRNRSGNLLASYPLSGQTGFNFYQSNLPALVQNTGVEFELKATAINKKDIKWNIAFNISQYKNKLLSFPNLLATSYATSNYVIGQPLNLLALYHFTGFTNGIAQFQDKNGDGKITAGFSENGKGDYIAAGTSDPKFYGGFNNTITYKNFQLDFFFNFVKQLGYKVATFPGLLSNQYRDVLNSQFLASTTSTSASYNSYVNYYINSDAKIVDASFIRLRNISLSFNMPQKLLSKLKMANLRIYVTGQNLLTITSYPGYDPETGIIRPTGAPPVTDASVSPPLKTFITGFQLTF